MTNAELHIAVLQRLYPGIFHKRISCLSHVLGCIGTGYEWNENGQVVSTVETADSQEEFARIAESIVKGTAPTVEQCYLEYIRKQANNKSNDYQNSLLRFHEENDNIPPIYHSYRESPICQIPDNVQPDWLCCCYELLDEMVKSKIDFDEHSIQPPGLQERLERYRNRTFIEKLREARLVKEVLNIKSNKTVRERGIERRKNQEQWEKLHSPKAKADPANTENMRARQIATQVLSDLEHRGLKRPEGDKK